MAVCSLAKWNYNSNNNNKKEIEHDSRYIFFCLFLVVRFVSYWFVRCWAIWLLHEMVVCITESKANIKHIWISLFANFHLSSATTTNTHTIRERKKNKRAIEKESLDCWQLCGILWKIRSRALLSIFLHSTSRCVCFSFIHIAFALTFALDIDNRPITKHFLASHHTHFHRPYISFSFAIREINSNISKLVPHA